MTTLKEFWKNLTPTDKDKLRTLLSSSLLVTTTTVSAYGNGARAVPFVKQDILKTAIKEHYNVSIVFSGTN